MGLGLDSRVHFPAGWPWANYISTSAPLLCDVDTALQGGGQALGDEV